MTPGTCLKGPAQQVAAAAGARPRARRVPAAGGAGGGGKAPNRPRRLLRRRGKQDRPAALLPGGGTRVAEEVSHGVWLSLALTLRFGTRAPTHTPRNPSRSAEQSNVPALGPRAEPVGIVLFPLAFHFYSPHPSLKLLRKKLGARRKGV